MKIIYAEIRKLFLDYFTTNNHLVIENSSLIPTDDPTLLIVNSGMAPLKLYFTGKKQPPKKRLCNIQKCVRTNDIEIIGDRHHLTFFEMMGNWSIGDYFKEEAITFAWKMIKDVFNFDTSHLFVTVYKGDKALPSIPPDEESEKIWRRFISPNQIIPLGASSNFWGPTGKTGPCGPCTEIFIDRGKKYGCKKINCGPDCKCGRFLEIWNAGVFMQYYFHEDKTLTELPLKSVDAGAGLDRFAVILQEVDSVYEIDILSPITEIFISGTNLDNTSKSVRILTDHIRCATFMIADGIFPANTGREYVLRRILRKALLHANISNITHAQILMASNTVIELFSSHYPELESSREVISSVITQEATAFAKTLRNGLKKFNKIIEHTSKVITGEDVFKLHDTHGLPFDMTKELAKMQNLEIDEKGYKFCLEEQKKRSRRK